MSEQRLIDANALMNIVQAQEWKEDTKVMLALDWIYMLIHEAPTIDPFRHGRWIPFEDSWKCSVCGLDDRFAMLSGNRVHDYFCPNCGTKMDGETTSD